MAGQHVQSTHAAIELRGDAAVELVNNGDVATPSSSMMQGRPIAEPVVQYGPVRHEYPGRDRADLCRTIRRTQFGGWPWDDAAPVHGRDPARFARHVDGRHDKPREAARGTTHGSTQEPEIVPVEPECTLDSAPMER